MSDNRLLDALSCRGVLVNVSICYWRARERAQPRRPGTLCGPGKRPADQPGTQEAAPQGLPAKPGPDREPGASTAGDLKRGDSPRRHGGHEAGGPELVEGEEGEREKEELAKKCTNPTK